jgi:hypothetical protein
VFRYSLVIGVALSIASTADAESIKIKNIDGLNTALHSHGCRQMLVREEEQATLLVSCDEDTVRADKDLRQWFFAADLSDSYTFQHKEEMTAHFVEYAADRAMLYYYQTISDMDQLAVVGRVIGRDDYGQPIDDIVFTFGFERDIFRKTDPDHIKTKGIRRISKNFYSFRTLLDGKE